VANIDIGSTLGPYRLVAELGEGARSGASSAIRATRSCAWPRPPASCRGSRTASASHTTKASPPEEALAEGEALPREGEDPEADGKAASLAA